MVMPMVMMMTMVVVVTMMPPAVIPTLGEQTGG